MLVIRVIGRVRQEDCEYEAIRWQKGGNREGKEEGGETRKEEKKELTPPLHHGREREYLAPQLEFSLATEYSFFFFSFFPDRSLVNCLSWSAIYSVVAHLPPFWDFRCVSPD